MSVEFLDSTVRKAQVTSSSLLDFESFNDNLGNLLTTKILSPNAKMSRLAKLD